MVKLDPATLPAPLIGMATIQASDPVQSFEAILAGGGEAKGPPLPRTAQFGELGMLGRHAATAAPELLSNLQAAAAYAADLAATQIAQPVEAQVLAEATTGVCGDARSDADIPGGLVRPGPRPQVERPSPQNSPSPFLVQGPVGEPAQPADEPPLGAATRPSRQAAADSTRQAQPVARIDIAGPGNGLQIALVASGLTEDGRDRVRRLMAEIAADLGLHLAEFSLNGQTVAAPSVGALGGSYGRNPG